MKLVSLKLFIKKMFKLFVGVFVVFPITIIAIIGIYYGWYYVSHYYFPWGVKKNIREFENGLKKIAKKEPQNFLLKDLTNFEWDRICFAEIYSADRDKLEENLPKELGVTSRIYVPNTHDYERAIYFIDSINNKVTPIYTNMSISNELEFNESINMYCADSKVIAVINYNVCPEYVDMKIIKEE